LHDALPIYLARNYFRYRWLLTYLIGASPFVAPNYATNLYGKPHAERMRSIRQSRYGYQNKESVVMNYDSLEDFVTSIEDAIDSGALSLEDRKSTRLNSSHVSMSYAVFCLKKKIPCSS